MFPSVFNFKFIILLYLMQNVHGSMFEIPDYKDHPCKRDCSSANQSLFCQYYFQVEWYTTLSKACYNCSTTNQSDCYRSHCVAANGVARSIITVNRMMPGPSIEVCENDIISVTVYNNMHLSEGTSIHWHGFPQKNTPWNDGVSMVTQCPIPPHSTFEYRLTALNKGTHFWHAHSGMQRADGVFGSLIVRQSQNQNAYASKYDYDLSEHVISVTDWLNEPFITKFLNHHHSDGNNKPSAILINGRGVYFENQLNITNVTEVPRAVFNVKKGFKYRFRLINAGNLYCPIQLSIDNHNLTVIASDGHDVEPVEVEVINIFAGERIDFILNTNQDVQTYWIRAKGFADCSVNKAYQTALLTYENSSTVVQKPRFEWATMDRPGRILNPWNAKVTDANKTEFIQVDELRSIDNISMLYNNTVNKKFYLAMEFNKIDNSEFQNPLFYSLAMTPTKRLFTPQINGISMMMPPYPTLYQWDDIPKEMICNDLTKQNVCPANSSYCSCIYVLEVDLNDLVELIVVDEGFTFQSNHPMHLHGHSFAVVGIEKLNMSVHMDTIKSMDSQGLLKRNLDHPPIKDTVTVPVGGYTILRFIADNPGTWLFHCHLEFHSEIGMMVMFKVGKSSDVAQTPIDFPKCGSYAFKSLKNTNKSPITSSNKFLLIISFFIFIISIINPVKLN